MQHQINQKDLLKPGVGWGIPLNKNSVTQNQMQFFLLCFMAQQPIPEKWAQAYAPKDLKSPTHAVTYIT
jgi:hypothetical protein